jgi:hypothetical protein
MVKWTDFTVSTLSATLIAICAIIAVFLGPPDLYGKLKRRRESKENNSQKEAKRKAGGNSGSEEVLYSII